MLEVLYYQFNLYVRVLNTEADYDLSALSKRNLC